MKRALMLLAGWLLLAASMSLSSRALGQISMNPNEYTDGQNPYQYALSNPLMSLDSAGLVSEQTPQEKALSGVPVVKCKDTCGPDVTDWFYEDLKEHYTRLTKLGKENSQKNFLEHWRNDARYNLSYKWMPFEADGCGTGKCKHTVMLAGVCIRKNQLGNIGFACLANAIPLIYGALEKTNPIKLGYDKGPIYDSKHPHAANFGQFAGVNRADNLAAFSIGYYIAGGKLGDMGLLKGSAQEFAAQLRLILEGKESFNKYADLYGKGANITKDSFTFIPEHGGFNTQSCQPCKSIYKGTVGSRHYFHQIKKDYEAQKPGISIDDWLRKTYENYVK